MDFINYPNFERLKNESKCGFKIVSIFSFLLKYSLPNSLTSHFTSINHFIIFFPSTFTSYRSRGESLDFNVHDLFHVLTIQENLKSRQTTRHMQLGLHLYQWRFHQPPLASRLGCCWGTMEVIRY